MEIESNNARYDVMVKKIFAYLLYRAENFYSKKSSIYSRVRIYDESFDYEKEIRSLGDPIGSVIGLIVFLPVIIFMLTGFLNGGFPIEIGTVFILLAWIGVFILGVNDFRRRLKLSFQYKQMERYFSLKSSLLDSLNLLKGQIIIDIKNEGIDPINVDLIGKMISEIGEVYSYIHGPMKDFSQLRDSIETKIVEILDAVVLAEKNEIIAFAQEFHNLLQVWLENHKIELGKEIDSLAQNPNEAIIMATSRLKIYIDSV